MSESKSVKPSRHSPQLAKLIKDMTAGETEERLVTADGRDLAAVLLGRRGGLKGGRARAASLSPEQRQKIAKAAAEARWKKQRDK